MFLFRRLAIAAAAVSVSGLVAIPSAFASTTRVVGTCPGATYTSIQAAVSASSPGDTIQLCAGTFTEQVTTTTSLAFVGAGSGVSTIQAPGTLSRSSCISGPTSIVDICGGATISMSNLTVAGPGPAGCGSLTYGIFVTGNASLTISNASVEHVRDAPLSGCQNGVGIRAGFVTPPSVGHLTMTNVTISDYQKNAVVVSGVGSTGNIQHSTTTGAGPQTSIAQNGIQVSSGATGVISNNTVTANECNHASCGPDPLNNTQSVGILLFEVGPGTTVSNNTVTNNDIGIYNEMNDAVNGPGSVSIISNAASGSRYEGILEDQGTSVVTSNLVNGGVTAGVAVISFSGSTQDSVITLMKRNLITNTGVALLVETCGVGGVPPCPGASTFTSRVKAKKNNFAGNTKGVINTTDNQLSVTKNWWGNASGPSDWGVGSGTTVSNDVTFLPWAKNTSYSALAACTITGPPGGNATLNAGSSNSIVCAQGGNNVLVGGSGKDLLIGGDAGGDRLIAGSGPTTMIGFGSPDALVGGSGRDSMEAPPGSNCTGGGLGTQIDCDSP